MFLLWLGGTKRKTTAHRSNLLRFDPRLLIRRHRTIEFIKRLQLGVLLEENIPFDPPRQGLGQLIPNMGPCGDGEDVVQLLQGALLRLRHEKEDQDKGGQVETGVEAERADRVQSLEHAGERDGQGRRPEKAGRYRPAHPDFSMRKGEDLGRIRIRHGAFARGVKCGEKVDEKGDEAKMGPVALGDDETQSGGEQRPCHLWKGEKQEVSSPPSINCPHRWPRKYEVDQAEPPTGEKCLEIARAGVSENRRRVERDDIDPTHLLRKHHDKGSKSGTSNPGNGEKFDEAGRVIAFTYDIGFFRNLSIDIVQITSSLDGSVSKSAKRFVCVFVSTFLDVPPGRLGTKIDTNDERYGRNEGRTELKSPRNVPGIVNCQISREPKEDSECSYKSRSAFNACLFSVDLSYSTSASSSPVLRG